MQELLEVKVMIPPFVLTNEPMFNFGPIYLAILLINRFKNNQSP